jgi:hypothetical protein
MHSDSTSSVPHAEEVAERQDVHAVQRAGEDQAEQHQAQPGAERVGDQSAETFLKEGSGDAEHGFRAEPGGEHHGEYDIHRQIAAGDDVVAGVVYLGGGHKADADGNDQVGDDEPEEHGRLLRKGSGAVEGGLFEAGEV